MKKSRFVAHTCTLFQPQRGAAFVVQFEWFPGEFAAGKFWKLDVHYIIPVLSLTNRRRKKHLPMRHGPPLNNCRV